jgi:transposase InsO family protein
MSENEALQYQLCATSCLRGNKCSLGTSTRGSHRSMEHQGQRTQVKDPVLNLLEVGTVKDKTSEQVTKTFEHLWLSHYPQPRTWVHDRGPEFVAHEFQTVLEDTGIHSRPTLARNPQSNGIIEQVHRTIAAIIRIIVDCLSPIDTAEKANDIVQDALHKAMHAVHCASHNSLDNISPGALTF